MIKGKIRSTRVNKLKTFRIGGMMKEWSAIKGIQDREMDEGIIKRMQQDFKESDWWKMGFGDP